MKLYILRLKYYLIRKWLVEEMIRDGWRQDIEDPSRLVLANPKDGTVWNMAQHEAISRHFKEFPLFPERE